MAANLKLDSQYPEMEPTRLKVSIEMRTPRSFEVLITVKERLSQERRRLVSISFGYADWGALMEYCRDKIVHQLDPKPDGSLGGNNHTLVAGVIVVLDTELRQGEMVLHSEPETRYPQPPSLPDQH